MDLINHWHTYLFVIDNRNNLFANDNAMLLFNLLHDCIIYFYSVGCRPFKLFFYFLPHIARKYTALFIIEYNVVGIQAPLPPPLPLKLPTKINFFVPMIFSLVNVMNLINAELCALGIEFL